MIYKGGGSIITLYYKKSSDRRTKQLLKWLNNHYLEYKVVTKSKLTPSILVHLLTMSESGFEELLVPIEKASSSVLDIYEKLDLKSLKTSDMIKVLILHQELLRTPIIFDEHKLLIGYNEEEMRKFLPRYH